MNFLAIILAVLFPRSSRAGAVETILRVAVVVGLVIYSVRYFTITVFQLGFDPGFMHGVHLIIHEAGHAITGVLTSNRTAVVLMGSGFQVLFPFCITCAFYFKNKDSFGSAVILWWTGHAVLDVAPYIADARVLQLELLTGGTGKEVEGHDWEYLLGQWGLLHQDVQIGADVALIGRLVMALALLWALCTLLHDRWLEAVDHEPRSS